MANSYDTYEADGSTAVFAVSFGYLNKTHVTVYVDGVAVDQADVSWPTLSSVNISAAHSAASLAGKTVLIVRSTSPTVRLVNWTNGTLNADTLNVDSVQAFYLAQEALERDEPDLVDLGFVSQAEVDAVQAALDAHLADTVDAHDASAISYVDTYGAGATTVQGIADTLQVYINSTVYPAITNHIADTTDAHDASAISIADAGGYFTGTDVEAALQELGAGGGGGGAFTTPGGRLTLTSATPVLTSDVSAATTIYYTPYLHDQIPLYDGATWVLTTFTELSNITSNSAVGNAGPAVVSASNNYDLFVWNDGGTIRLTRGPLWFTDSARGTGASTSELERVNGIYVNKQSITNGPAAQRGTYVGTVRSNGSSQIDWKMGATGTAGTQAASLHVWNMYNRVLATANVRESADSFTYGTDTFRSMNNSTGNRVSTVRGLNEDHVVAIFNFTASVQSSGAGAASYVRAGIGVNSTTAMSGLPGTCYIAGGASITIQVSPQAIYAGAPGLGWCWFQALEASIAGGAATMYGDAGAPTKNQTGLTVTGNF
jgi:hypothetical protein